MIRKVMAYVITILFVGTGICPNILGYYENTNQKNQNQTNLNNLEDFDFDIIYINDIYTELCWECGITTIYSFCLIANTGSTTITESDLLNIKINVSSDIEGAKLSIYAHNMEGKQIEPGQVAGTITEENQLLTDFLESGETLVNWVPTQTIFFMVDRKNYIGNATFNITINIRGKIAYLQTNVNFQNGDDHYIEYLSGERKSSNTEPNSPVITGPTNGFPFISYLFTFTSTDPDGDDVSYYIDWGDGFITNWTSYQPSGSPDYSEEHSWTGFDKFTIRAKAKDTFGLESHWTNYSFSTPRNRAINTLFIVFLQIHPNLFSILRLLFQRSELQ